VRGWVDRWDQLAVNMLDAKFYLIQQFVGGDCATIFLLLLRGRGDPVWLCLQRLAAVNDDGALTFALTGALVRGWHCPLLWLALLGELLMSGGKDLYRVACPELEMNTTVW
jgi:hypothetical protein